MSASIIIPIAMWQAARRRKEEHKREQALIEAVERELDEEPALSFEEALRRSEKREGERAR